MCTRIRSGRTEVKKYQGLHYRKSTFSWVVTGMLSHERVYQPQSFQVSVELDLARSWEIEDVPRMKSKKIVSVYNEKMTSVADDGRITVHPAFKPESRPSNNLQTTKQILFALEKKLKNDDDDDVKEQYRAFIKEFVDMGLLEEAPQNSGLCFYLPHHCVFKASTTSKLRLVFDSSSGSTNSFSPKDCLLLGPRLQDDVLTSSYPFASINMRCRQMCQRCTGM